MGCPCRLPVEKYPETADWGPLFWKLLHALAELAGKQRDAVVMQGDEVRAWIQVLTLLQQCIPCDVCRNHYAIWLAAHPPSVLATLPYNQIGDWIRNNLWELHNTINEGNDRPTLPKSELGTLYRGVSITVTWRTLEPVMKRAIILNGVSLFPWKKWLAVVRTLEGMYV